MQALEFVNYINDNLGYGTVTTITGTLSDYTRKVIKICEAVLRTHANAGHTPEMRKRASLNVTAPVTGQQAAVTYGSASLTSTDDPFTSAMTGAIVRVGTDTAFYRIATVVGIGSVTLDRPYLGDTNADTTCDIAIDRYELPSDFSELLGKTMLNMVTGQTVDEVDPSQMRKNKADIGVAYGSVVAEPQTFVVHGKTDDNANRYIHFDYFPDQVYGFEYEYEIKHPDLNTDTQEILIPDHMFLAITDAILARAKRDLEMSMTASERLMMAEQEKAKAKQSFRNGEENVRFKPTWGKRGYTRRR